MYTELKAGRDAHVMGYSQGALITARALRDLANRLRIEDGMPQARVEALMSRINVETFGGAGAIFPDGPNYVHYVNTKDVVPVAFGLGNALSCPGLGAVVHEFSEGKSGQFTTAHDLDDSYLPHRIPFEQARNGFYRPSEPRSPRQVAGWVGATPATKPIGMRPGRVSCRVTWKPAPSRASRSVREDRRRSPGNPVRAMRREKARESRVSAWQNVGATSLPPGLSTALSAASAPGRSGNRCSTLAQTTASKLAGGNPSA